jgi:hypothetical protein
LKNARRETVLWIEARGLIKKSVLVDHVHLNAEAYEIWDGVLNGGGGKRRRKGRRGGKDKGRREGGLKCSQYWGQVRTRLWQKGKCLEREMKNC